MHNTAAAAAAAAAPPPPPTATTTTMTPPAAALFGAERMVERDPRNLPQFYNLFVACLSFQHQLSFILYNTSSPK